VLTIAVNFAGFVGAVYLFTRRNGFFIVAVLLVVSSLSLSIALGYSAYSRTSRVGVAVCGDVEVKNIPRNDSGNAFVLAEGETAQIVGTSEPFYFVQTVLGRKGWVRRERLCVVGEEYDEVFDRIEAAGRTNGFRGNTQEVGK
jgi:hypothetical protein